MPWPRNPARELTGAPQHLSNHHSQPHANFQNNAKLQLTSFGDEAGMYFLNLSKHNM